VLLKSWDLCHLKGNHLSYPGKFESPHLHGQNNFYGISKFADQSKEQSIFLKKIARARSARNGPIRRESGPDLPAAHGSRRFKWLANGARRLAPLGGRIGTRRSWPSDQVVIDDQRLSSTRERNGAAKTLGFCLGVAGAHRGAAGWWERVGGGRGGS
jgi:hypothetical protein